MVFIHRVNCNKYKKFCRRCNAFKPRRAHHCSVCKRCIIKMDHHCPWLNNCVGIGNHKLFIQFIFWVNMMSCYSLILNASRYVSCINAGLACGSVLDHTMSLLVLLESILFALFTTCMMCDQWSVVSTNQTQIDRMKQMKPESKSVTFNEVFGVDHSVSFRFHFLCPTPVHFPANLKDEILGYSIPLNLIASSGSRYNDNSNDNNDKDGSYEMTPLTSAVDDEEGDDDVHTHTLSSQHRVGTDLSHIFNSPGGHGASSNVTHNNNNSSGGVGVRIYSGLYESKEEEEEELLLLNNNHHINGDTPKKSIFPSMFPSFSTLTSINANSQPLTLSVRPDPPSSPSKESPHRGSGLGLGLHNDSVDVGTPSSGQSSNQESLMESKSIFMRKRMPTTSTVV